MRSIMVKNRILVGLFLFSLLSCKPKEVGSKLYVKYMNDTDNGLLKTKEISGIAFDLLYNTPELMAIRDAGDESKIDLSKLIKEYEGLYYFNLRVRSAEQGEHILTELKKSREEILGMDSYMNFDMQHDFYLIDGADTCKCVLYTMDKTYGLSKDLNFSLAFDKKMQDSESEKILVYDDKIFGCGIVRFSISGKDISSIPKLKLNV
jgi:hypothetical protein